ncbi:MAG: hypothetical protein SVR08_02405 [Spirochaetota bacterium]|nr:hypothetical protein [Spirochaetota bacterium]
MEFIEEKTPDGITLKVMLKKGHFLAFNRSGSVIYADEEKASSIHELPVIFFMSIYLKVERRKESALQFYKIINNEIVIPYSDLRDNKRYYQFVKINKTIDLIPVLIYEFKDITALVREMEKGTIPNTIVVDSNVHREDIVILKNRNPDATVVLAGEGDNKQKWERYKKNDLNKNYNRRAVEETNEKNLNMMSENPVFLARIHLRKMDISKVNQLLLDFDISPLEAEYILQFIHTMLEKEIGDAMDDIQKNRSKLMALVDSFQFYLSLLNKNSDEVKKMIEKTDDTISLASYNTILAKVKLFFPEEEEQLMFIEYENLLFEKKDQIQSKKH